MDDPSSSKPPIYPDHSRLMEWRDGEGDALPVTNRTDWNRRRRHALQGMVQMMGPLPADRCPLDVRLHSKSDAGSYVRHKIDYVPEPGDRVPAYLLIPKFIVGRAPAVMCLHQTTQIGKDEPAGLGGNPNLHYAHELASRGYVCLVPDYPTLGEYKYDFDTDRYPSGSMKGIFNHVRGVDLLCQHESVDSERIGAIGHSLGGHNTMFLASFDDRVRTMVSCCGFTAFCKYYGGDLTGWSGPRYMPRIKGLSCRDVPFDFHEVVAGFAPRPFMAVAPLHDSNFDNAGVREVMEAARAVYELFGEEQSLVARYPDAQHDFPPDDRRAAYAFLDKHLSHEPTE